MKEIDVASEAEFKAEMRRLYHTIGMNGCMQVLYEIMKSAEWLSEIILEEKAKETKR